MKKIAVYVFLLNSIFMANASMPDDSIHPKKINSERPLRCFSAAVPPCLEDMPAYLAALEAHQNHNSSNQLQTKKPLSESQELKRCP